MKKLVLSVTVLAVLLAGCDKVDPNSPEGKREAIFKQLLKSKEHMGGMLRGRIPFVADDFTQHANEVENLAQQPWQYFPVPENGKATGQAKDAVWKDQQRFKQLTKQLEQTTKALALAAHKPNLQPADVQPAFKKVEDTCSECHKAFRIY